MGINLGTGFGNLNGNTNNTNQTSGMILNLNKNYILESLEQVGIYQLMVQILI